MMLMDNTRLQLWNWRQQVALDLGTATIRIAAGRGAVFERSSCLGEREGLRGGVIVDQTMVVQLLKPLLDRTRLFGIVKPCVLACAPSDVNRIERARLTQAVLDAGAASVYVIPEPLAAAVGAGLDVSSSYAQVVVDIGAGVTDCALIRMSRIQATAAVRIGCSQLQQDAARPQFARERVAGLLEGFLHNLSPKIGCEAIENGICLTGGGALIPGLPAFLEARTGITVTPAATPCYCVVEGARAILPVVVMLNLWNE